MREIVGRHDRFFWNRISGRILIGMTIILVILTIAQISNKTKNSYGQTITPILQTNYDTTTETAQTGDKITTETPQPTATQAAQTNSQSINSQGINSGISPQHIIGILAGKDEETTESVNVDPEFDTILGIPKIIIYILTGIILIAGTIITIYIRKNRAQPPLLGR